MCLVAIHVSRVVQQIVLITRLHRVIGERPVDEILYRTDESDVIVDGIVVIRRPQKWAIASVHAARIALHAVENLGPGLKASYPFAKLNIRHRSSSLP